MTKKVNFKNLLLGIFIVLFGFAVILFSRPVLADNTSITLMPVKFILDLKPEEISEQKLIIVNPNNFEIALKAQIEDFEPSPNSADINFIPKAPGITSLVDWIKLQENLEDPIILKPNVQREIFFTINVPEKPEPGSHFAAIFLKTQPLAGQTGSSLSISTRLGSLILVTIPGNVARGGEIVSFRGPKFVNKGPVEFFATFKNTGSVHYQASGVIRLKNMFGKQTAEITTDSQWILPTGQKTLKAVWDVKYIFGPHKALLEIKDGAGNIHQASFKFFAIPWQETLLALIGLLILACAVYYFKKKFKITITTR